MSDADVQRREEDVEDDEELRRIERRGRTIALGYEGRVFLCEMLGIPPHADNERDVDGDDDDESSDSDDGLDGIAESDFLPPPCNPQ